MKNDWVKKTAKWSAISQVFFGLITFIGFAAPVKNDVLLFLLCSDIGVQVIEFLFYVVFIYYNKLPTYYRYIDWYVTTPVQLVSTMILLKYFNDKHLTLSHFLNHSRNDVVFVVVQNFVMLSFGLLAEFITKYNFTLVTLGILPFIANFYIIYTKYAYHTTEGIFVTTYVCVIWILYAVAAYMNYVTKNIMYNILDIFSKNFYGVFISIYMLL